MLSFLTAAGASSAARRAAPPRKGPELPTARERMRFSELAAATRTPLLSYLVKQGATLAEAEDCLQEALVRAYGALSTLEDWGKARSWLFGIARHVQLDELRRKAVRNRPLEVGEASADPEAMEASALAPKLREALAELAPPKGEILDLHYVAGLTVEEIGEVLSLPSGTVKTHMHRARTELRRRLGAMEL